jgi:hypothetical protein
LLGSLGFSADVTLFGAALLGLGVVGTGCWLSPGLAEPPPPPPHAESMVMTAIEIRDRGKRFTCLKFGLLFIHSLGY